MSVGNDPEFVPSYIDAPYVAAEAFEKALGIAVKKYEKKDALEGLNEAGRKLNQIGNYQINAEDYVGAYKTLSKVLTVNNALAEKGGEAVIQAEEIGNQKFVVAYCASAAGDAEAAGGLFKELYDAGSEEPTVYAQYGSYLLTSGDEEAGVKVLEEGKVKFPGKNTEILFALINYHIGKGNFEILEGILKDAIKAEPTNPSVRSALGNVYMNLYTDEYSANGETEVATGYFDKSMDYFNQAIEIEPKQFDAIYSIGSLYFNKAVEMIKVANELGLDKESVIKYNKLVAESNSLMETALPYFQKAEGINPNDNNTLIALTEIYARMNDFEKSKEFKQRLENVKNGETNEAYFKM